jgi:hypothetical protein
LMNDDGFPDDVGDAKPVRKKAHARIPVVGEQDREISRMISVRLVGRIPVFAGSLKRVVRVSDSTAPVFVNVEPVRTDWLPLRRSVLIGGKSGDFHEDLGSVGDVDKHHHPPEMGGKGTALYVCKGASRYAAGRIRRRDRYIVFVVCEWMHDTLHKGRCLLPTLSYVEKRHEVLRSRGKKRSPSAGGRCRVPTATDGERRRAAGGSGLFYGSNRNSAQCGCASNRRSMSRNARSERLSLL